MRDQISSPEDDRRTAGERRHNRPRSIYSGLDETIRKIEADRRRTSGRRRTDLPIRTVRRMPLDKVLQLASDALESEHPQLDVVGVTGADGYVELLIAIRGCHVDPCRLTIGFDRTISPAEVPELLQQRIRDHLSERPH